MKQVLLTLTYLRGTPQRSLTWSTCFIKQVLLTLTYLRGTPQRSLTWSTCFRERVLLTMTYLCGTLQRLLAWSTCFRERVPSTKIYVLGYFLQFILLVCFHLHPANIHLATHFSRHLTLLLMPAMSVDICYDKMEASA